MEKQKIITFTALAFVGMFLVLGLTVMLTNNNFIGWHKLDVDDLLVYTDLYTSTFKIEVKDKQITLFDEYHKGRNIRILDFERFHKVPCEVIITGSDYTIQKRVVNEDTTFNIPHFSWVNITVVMANSTWSADSPGLYNIYSYSAGSGNINISCNDGFEVNNPYIAFYTNPSRTSMKRIYQYNGTLTNYTNIEIELDAGMNYLTICSDSCFQEISFDYTTHGNNDKKFYWGSQNGVTFDTGSKNGYASTELTSTQYVYIESNDGTYIQLANAEAKYFHASVKISTGEYYVHNISWLYDVFSEVSNEYTLYIWNDTASVYEILDNSTIAGSYNNLEGYKNVLCNHYINSTGWIDTMLFFPDPGSGVKVTRIDYVSMDILTNVTEESFSWEITKETSFNISTYFNETEIDEHNGYVLIKMYFNATANYTNPQLITTFPVLGTHDNTVVSVKEGLSNITLLTTKTYSDETKIYINASNINNGSSRYYEILYNYRENKVPVLPSIANQKAYLRCDYTFVVRGTDADPEDELNYSLLVRPAGMTINQTNGLIEWNPSVEGRYKVTVQLTDGIDTTTQTFYITAEYSLFRIGWENFTAFMLTGGAMLTILLALFKVFIVPLIAKSTIKDTKDALTKEDD